MGIGMVVWGLASVIIGEALVGVARSGLRDHRRGHGSVLFRLIVALALRWGLNPNDLKLITAVFVFVALVAAGRSLQRVEAPGTVATQADVAMLEIRSVFKTFNAGTPNEVRALRGVDPDRSTKARSSSSSARTARESRRCSTPSPAASSSTRGTITLDGPDITRWPEHRRASLIGRVFQNPFSGTAPTMSIAENLALAARRGRARGLGWALHARDARASSATACAALNMRLEDAARQPDRQPLRRPAPGADAADGHVAAGPSCCCSTSTPPPSIRRAPTRSSG